MSAATLIDFATVNDRAGATTKKLQKQQIVAEYFRSLDDQDLPIGVRFCGGRAFASTDERVLGVSGAIVSDVVLRITKMEPRAFYDLAVKHGEIGEALSTIWSSEHKPTAEPWALTLRDLSGAFDQIASTGNIARKKELLHELFSRCVHGREAAYLAKIIFSDLRTGVREGVLHDAIAKAFDRNRDEIQRAQLMTGDLGEVALLARRGELDRAQFRLFHPIQFMLATPKETASEAAEAMEGRPYFAEDKLDGIRAQVHKSGDRLVIYTRTMDRIDESFPDVVESLQKIAGDFLLDGEIVPYRDGRVLPFAHIQKRLGRKSLTAKIIRENPAVFIAFDILYLNGEVLIAQPLRVRRARLVALTPLPAGEGSGEGKIPDAEDSPHPQPLPSGEGSLLTTNVVEVTAADKIEQAFCTARDCGNEGLVLKDPDSIYSPGRRGQAWLKLKTHLPTLDCVVTAAEYGHGKRKGVLSDYTFAVWDRDPPDAEAKLVNIGKAYSGVTDEEIAQLTKIFMEIAREQRWGRVFMVEPKIVMEIAFDQIQPSKRHESGYALRFPRIKRIRWDKSAADADRLSRVVEIYQSSANTARRDVKADQVEPTLFDGL